MDEIIKDIIDSKRDYIIEFAVDEYLAAEASLITEANTSADRMVDIYLDADVNKEEINGMLDEEITDDIEDEEYFNDTMDGEFDDEIPLSDPDNMAYDDIDEFIDNNIIVDSELDDEDLLEV